MPRTLKGRGAQGGRRRLSPKYVVHARYRLYYGYTEKVHAGAAQPPPVPLEPCPCHRGLGPHFCRLLIGILSNKKPRIHQRRARANAPNSIWNRVGVLFIFYPSICGNYFIFIYFFFQVLLFMVPILNRKKEKFYS